MDGTNALARFTDQPVLDAIAEPLSRAVRDVTPSAAADTYLEYLKQTGLSEYGKVPGNRAVVALRRVRDGRAEFLLLTLWDSDDAIRLFAGPDMDRAVYYPEDDRFLLEGDEQVDHFEVVFSNGGL